MADLDDLLDLLQYSHLRDFRTGALLTLESAGLDNILVTHPVEGQQTVSWDEVPDRYRPTNPDLLIHD